MLVALGNPENARALVDVGVRLTGRLRPSEVLLVRLIPTARAPEFRTGLRDEESQMDRSVEAMERLAQQVSASGLTVRSVSFLSDDVGQDLAYMAETQRCTTILLGWHRASLERHVVKALVHRVFAKAPCDVVVFVDAKGAGVAAEPRVVLVASDGHRPTGAAAVGQRLAESLGTETRPLSHAASAKDWPAVQVEQAAALVVEAGDPRDGSDFGQPATSIADNSARPVLVVRSAAT